MTTNIDIETKVIERFIIKTKRERYLTFIKNDKTREKFISELYHADIFIEELFDKIIGSENEIIKDRIKHLPNKNNCYIISTNKEIDRKVLVIETAFRDAISIYADQGTLIVFGDAEIIYREAEGIKKKWISKVTKFK